MPSLLDSRNGPAFDTAPDPGARCWVLASTPRTGSTWLARTLWNTGEVGAPKEYLNPTQIRDWEVRFGGIRGWLHRSLRGPTVALAGRTQWSDARLSEYLRRVRLRRSSGGWFGLKIHWHHFERFFVDAGRDPEAFLGPVTWVRIQREDRLAQAVSWVRALQTGAWAAHQHARIPPVYNRRFITHRLADIDAAEVGWDAIIPRSTHQVTYETLVRDVHGTTAKVLQHLGVSSPPPDPADLSKQADALTDAWVARYRAGE